ncbi:putative mcm2 3 5 family protein [Hirsutella rhossiliensis]|uniref:Mcm2 3 5 family protein n=1 Tax=Hirsutella rhossiliensis TaxID=111463 RepID=A0A9P8SMK2_9HYPO|nr:putative mcm2 3 5 family protein [Hirsutella rhossiliensis]KAH0967414.1 putative mcm2 3 5 family protein [Hirsutella rhossiliensis]
MAANKTDAPDVADPLRSHLLAEDITASPQTALPPRGPPDRQNFPGHDACHPMPLATGPLESIALGDDAPSPASPPLATNELGILSRKNTLWPSVAAVSSAEASISPTESPPLTGASLGGFSIGSPTMSSAAASPRIGLLSRRHRQPTTVLERVKTVFSRRATSSHETGSEPLQPSAGSEGLQGVSDRSDVEAEAGQGLGQGGGGESDGESDEAMFKKKFAEAPTYCSSKRNVQTPRNGPPSIVMIGLSFISTAMSIGWLWVAGTRPRYGHVISSSGFMLPATATILATLVSRSIELISATVVISCVGQILSQRSANQPERGMTLAEMTMRNWILQPGTIITGYGKLKYTIFTVLGLPCLLAAVAITLYTPASDALVSPKLLLGKWQSRELVGLVRSSYANTMYAKRTCPYMFREDIDKHAPESCLNVQFSGQSYRNLQGFMERWMSISGSVSGNSFGYEGDLAQRPVGTNLLYDNTTMTGVWIETEHANVTGKFEEHQRIVNNVTMAMPHPGVYAAATSRTNGILQPDDLDSMGEYSIRASVVSPTINVMCVNMSRDELAPLVYTEWPRSRTRTTGVGNQTKGLDDWAGDVPRFVEGPRARYLNRTVVDDIFRWGPKYERWPPAFQFYPADYNLAINASGYKSDALYLLAKRVNMTSYTLCETRSWLSPKCSTHFNISGTAGANMWAHCEDAEDPNAYRRWVKEDPNGDGKWGVPDKDWKHLAEQWRLSMDLNGGSYNNNASNARILTQLALDEHELPSDLPSLAEAVAVFGSSMLVIGSVDTPFRHNWTFTAPDNVLEAPGLPQRFHASIISKEYQSGDIKPWKRWFYLVLAVVPVVNVCCLAYFSWHRRIMTDFTEPVNVFALAMNSPPSSQIKGSCGGGPQEHHFMVPWRVTHIKGANHYFFESANERPWSEKHKEQVASAAKEYGQVPGSNARKLRLRRGWL